MAINLEIYTVILLHNCIRRQILDVFVEVQLNLAIENNWFQELHSEFGENASIVEYSLGQKYGATGHLMVEMLRQKNIVRLGTGERIQLLDEGGALSNGTANNAKRLRPDELARKNKLKNSCMK